MADTPDKIELGNYFLERLVQLGVKYIHGVPGDFNLAWLDMIEDHEGLDWIGCCNELNASYAADGYARVSEGGVGCLVTTFGVGGLSAVNGITGAHSERVPIIHIVGVPSTKLQAQHSLLHHTLGDGRFDAFTKIAENVTAAQLFLSSARHATRDFDKTLRAALRLARPVYVTLPTDLVHVLVDATPLKTDLRQQLDDDKAAWAAETEAVEEVVEEIARRYVEAQNPIVLIDACCIRFRVERYALELVEATGMPFPTTPMGKGAISECHPQFGGMYIGDVSVPAVRQRVESSDLVISISQIMSDFNSGSFTYRLTPLRIELHSDHTVLRHAHYPNLGFRHLLPALTSKLASLRITPQAHGIPDPGLTVDPPAGATADGSHATTQAESWPLWGKFFRKGDVILAETGTSSFGVLDAKTPEDVKILAQVLWGSIGWTGGACLGAAQAAEAQGRRTILFIGDGSLQLTAQEISTMLRVGVKPIIVVLDNDGYTIERCKSLFRLLIHGMKRKYNDIAPWDFSKLLSTLARDSTEHRTYLANTRAELEKVLADPEFARADQLQLVAVKLPKEDAPRALRVQASLTAKANAD